MINAGMAEGRGETVDRTADAAMDMNNLGLFRLLNKKMDWLGQRQEVLAENVANADTPKYRPNDLANFDFKTALAEPHHLRAATTHPAHQAAPQAGEGPGKLAKTKRPYETKPDGNAVIVEEQMLKVSQTVADYNTVTNLYRKNVALLKMALGRSA
jgi:flagellar basal-body rod protein FlgB